MDNKFEPQYTFGKFQCAVVVEKMLARRNDGKHWRNFIHKTYQDVSWLTMMPSKNTPKNRVVAFLKDERLAAIDAKVPDDTKDNIDFKTHMKNLIVTIFRAKVERPTESYQKICRSKKTEISSWKCKESHGIDVPFDERIGYQEEMKWAKIDIYSDNGSDSTVVAGLNKLIKDGRFHEIDKLFLNMKMKFVRTNMLVTIAKNTLIHKHQLKNWNRFFTRITYTLNQRREHEVKKTFDSMNDEVCEPESGAGC